MLVTLDDMKEHLRIEQDDTTQDGEIKRPDDCRECRTYPHR